MNYNKKKKKKRENNKHRNKQQLNIKNNQISKIYKKLITTTFLIFNILKIKINYKKLHLYKYQSKSQLLLNLINHNKNLNNQ